MELFGIEKKLNRVIAPNSFKFLIIFYSHTNQIQVIKDYITQKFEDTKHTTLDLNNTTYQKLSSQLYNTENGFVFIDRLEKLFENEDLYHGFNQRRDKIAKHKINLICFAHIDSRKEILKNFASLAPDLWEFKNAVLEIREKGEVQEVKNLENWNFQDLGGSNEQEVREEIKKIEIALTKAKIKDLQINLRLQLLSLYTKVGELKRAEEYGNTLLEIIDKYKYKNREKLLFVFSELGKLYRSNGDLEKSLLFHSKSIKIFEELYDNENYYSLAAEYGNLAETYRLKGNLDKALEYQLKNIEIMLCEDDNHPNLAIAYGNLSAIYYSMNEKDKAFKYQLKKVDMFRSYGNENHPELAIAYANLSLIYRDKGDLDEALEFQFKSLKITKEIYDNDNHTHFMNIYWFLGIIYYELNNIDEAKKFIEKAYGIYKFNFPNGHSVYEDSLESWYKEVCS